MKLIAQNLAVVRGEELIFSNLSFTLNSGQALVIRGPNGAGKSTLLRALVHLLPLHAGTLQLEFAADEKQDPDFDETAHLVDHCHYLSTDNGMKTAMSVEENLLFWQKFSGNAHMDVMDALAMVGLEGLQAIPFGHLSTGQRRRIAICRLLVSYRPIWILDEPTSGLDAASEQQFSALMQAHIDDGGMIIAATHIALDLKRAHFLDYFENHTIGQKE